MHLYAAFPTLPVGDNRPIIYRHNIFPLIAFF